jgi:hypothetical protein
MWTAEMGCERGVWSGGLNGSLGRGQPRDWAECGLIAISRVVRFGHTEEGSFVSAAYQERYQKSVSLFFWLGATTSHHSGLSSSVYTEGFGMYLISSFFRYKYY